MTGRVVARARVDGGSGAARSGIPPLMLLLSKRVIPLAGLICAVSVTVTPPASPAATPEGTQRASLPCPQRGDVTAKSSTGDRAGLHYLTDVRAAGHPCHDRVVFEFQPGDHRGGPGYAADYRQPPLREDGRGRRVEVAGRHFVVVRMSPARDVRLSAGRAEPTYRGPDSIRPATARHVVEVRHVGSFEGRVTWAVGLHERRPFEVTVLDSPPRLVVDFR